MAPALLSGRNRAGWLLMVVGMFMAVLDIQIVASSLGEIQGGLAAAPDEIAWVQTSYLIAEVIMIPLSGFLARLLSTRILFTLSALGFTLASVACALVDTIGGMVVARIVQGFIGGAMIPTVFSTAYLVFPRHRQAAMMVIIGMVATMAPTLGPSLGGWLTTSYSWHWLFLVNVLPGIVVTLGVWLLLDVDRPEPGLLRGFDALGLVSMALFLGSLEYVLDEGPDHDWLDDPVIALFVAVTLGSAVLFFVRVLRHWNPIVDLRPFRDRNFALGCGYGFLLGAGLYGSIYLLPLVLARARGYSALDIGLVMMVTGIAQFLAAPIAGRLSDRLDPRLMLTFGMALFGVGIGLNGFMTSEVGFAELGVPQAIRGAAMLFCFIPINRLALGTLPAAELKNASGLFNLTRNLGGAVSLALLNSFLDHRLAVHLGGLARHLSPANPAFVELQAVLTAQFADLLPARPELAALQRIGGIVTREATILSFNDGFLLLGAILVGSLVLMPLVRRPATDAGP